MDNTVREMREKNVIIVSDSPIIAHMQMSTYQLRNLVLLSAGQTFAFLACHTITKNQIIVIVLRNFKG